MIKREEISEYGFKDFYIRQYPGKPVDPPDDEQIRLCREFIKQHMKPNKRGHSSYHFKHVVERHAGKYITNGAFIVAALKEGCQMKRIGTGPNAQIFLEVKENKEGKDEDRKYIEN